MKKKMMTTFVLCLIALPVVTVAQQTAAVRAPSPVITVAQQGQAAKAPAPAEKTSITVVIPGLNCTTPAGGGSFAVQAYSWGASNPVTIGGTGPVAGKVSISSLNVLKQFDACSPLLFESVAKGAFFKILTLTQRNPEGEAVSIIGLENVFVESWQVGSSTDGPSATESVSFAAQKFCVTDVASGNKFCYDLLLQKLL